MAIPEQLRQSVAAADTYRMGEPIVMRYELANDGDTAWSLLVWETPLEAEVFNYVEVRHGDRVVPYDGRLVKRGDPIPEDYRLLGPGETLVADVDLSTSFAFDEPGTYTVSLHVRFLDVVPQPAVASGPPAFGDTGAPRARQQHEGAGLEPLTVQFEVVPDGEPRLTSGQRVRAQLGARRRVASADWVQMAPESRVVLDPAARRSLDVGEADALDARGLVGGEIPVPAWFADSFEADQNALAWVESAIEELASWTGRTDNALYTEWFGSDDVGRYQAIRDHFAAIRAALVRPHTYDGSQDDCSPNTYAFTYPGSDTVWLCSLWFNAPKTGADSKFGTFVHEWSHAVAGTDDIAYGQAACRGLAVNQPQDAVRNADSHEYFVETLADRMLTGAVVWNNGKAYLFAAGRYWRYDVATDRVDPGYPLPIAGNWPGLWPDRIDAGVVWPNGKAYFFRDGSYMRYDLAADRVDPGYPLGIADHWPGLGGDPIDAAVVWPNGKAYFFRKSQYWRYDIAADRVDPGYPLPIGGNWPGLWGDGIQSAVVWNNGKAYLLRGWQYVRYDIAGDRVDGGYPRAIAENWPLLWNDRIDAATFWPNGKAYFFRSTEYMRYDNPTDRVDPGYPLPIDGNWPGLGAPGIDACAAWPNGKAFFFRGSRYWRYDVATDTVDPGYPLAIAGNWPGLPVDRVDAVITWPNNKAYFFRGSEYWRYDIATDRVDDGYPLPIADFWPGLGAAPIDAAIMWNNGKAYFFRGSQYWRYDIAADRVDDGYPTPIGWNWPWLPGRVR